jgi:hypothetical protein
MKKQFFMGYTIEDTRTSVCSNCYILNKKRIVERREFRLG